MKLEKYFLLLALGVFAFALQSCDDDDNDGISVPAELSNALAKEHPNAQRIEWETKGAYYVADFHEDNFEKGGLVHQRRCMADDRNRPPLCRPSRSGEKLLRVVPIIMYGRWKM